MGLDAKQIVAVAVTPCTAKKFEIRRDEMNSSAEILGYTRNARYRLLYYYTGNLQNGCAQKKSTSDDLEDSALTH